MKDAVICIAAFTAKEGRAEQLGAALKELIAPTRSEEGCVSYELFRGLHNANLFTMVEVFKNQDAFEFHGNQPYLDNFKKNVGELVSSVSVNLHRTAYSES